MNITQCHDKIMILFNFGNSGDPGYKEDEFIIPQKRTCNSSTHAIFKGIKLYLRKEKH